MNQDLLRKERAKTISVEEKEELDRSQLYKLIPIRGASHNERGKRYSSVESELCQIYNLAMESYREFIHSAKVLLVPG